MKWVTIDRFNTSLKLLSNKQRNAFLVSTVQYGDRDKMDPDIHKRR